MKKKILGLVVVLIGFVVVAPLVLVLGSLWLLGTALSWPLNAASNAFNRWVSLDNEIQEMEL